MKRALILICALVLALPLSGQKISFYKSPLDSVVLKMDEIFPGRVFFVPDTTDNARFTIRVDSQSAFLDEAVKALKGEGYSVTEQNGNLFILKGIGISTSLPLQYFDEQTSLAASSQEYLDALSEDAKIANFANRVYELGGEDNWPGGKL